MPEPVARGLEHFGEIVAQVLLPRDGGLVLVEDGLRGEVLRDLGVRLIALGGVRERLEADIEGVARREEGPNVLEREPAEDEVEALHIARKPLHGHDMEEFLEDARLAALALAVRHEIVSGQGLVQYPGDECVRGRDRVILQHAAVGLHARRHDGERWVRQHDEDHGADLAVGILGRGHDSSLSRVGRALTARIGIVFFF